MKTTFFILAIGILALAAPAQVAGVYFFDATNAIPATSTNNSPAYAGNPNRSDIVRVDEFDNGGLAVSFTPSSASAGNCTFRFSRSMDGGTTFVRSSALVATASLGSTTNRTSSGFVFDLSGSTHLKLDSIENTNAVTITNLTVSLNLKSPKFGAKQATR